MCLLDLGGIDTPSFGFSFRFEEAAPISLFLSVGSGEGGRTPSVCSNQLDLERLDTIILFLSVGLEGSCTPSVCSFQLDLREAALHQSVPFSWT